MQTPRHLWWRICLLVALSAPAIFGAGPAAGETLEQHLNRVVLKRVEYRDVPLQEALVDWSKLVHAQSPRKFAIRVYDGPTPSNPGGSRTLPGLPGLAPEQAAQPGQPPAITLTLSQVPALEVLKYLANLGGYQFDLTDHGVALFKGSVQRLGWGSKTFPMPPAAKARAKAVFAQGPLPRPQFTLEGAIALTAGLPPRPVTFRWNANRNAVTVEGDLDSIAHVEPCFINWALEPPKPAPPPRMTALETKVLALYERLHGLVLRDVVLRKPNLKEALAELDRVCIQATGDKTAAVGLTIGGPFSPPSPAQFELEAKEITAREALMQILQHGASRPYLHARRGRLMVSDQAPEKDEIGQYSQPAHPDRFPMGKPKREGENLLIAEYKVPPPIFRTRLVHSETGDLSLDDPRNAPKKVPSFPNAPFNAGCFVMYSPASQTLVVKDTPERLLQIKKKVCDALAEAEAAKPSVRVERTVIDGNVPVVEN